MYADLIKKKKDLERAKPSSEIGIIMAITPHLVVDINGQEVSSEFFTFYVPAVDRIKQWEEILGDDLEPGVPYKQQITVDIGDLELEPDLYERRFLIGDLVDITDRGDTFIIHGRLVRWDDTQELHGQVHRQR